MCTRATLLLLQVQTALAIHLAFILPAVAIGLACGLCGFLFTIVNVKVMRLRNEIIGVRCMTPPCHCRAALAAPPPMQDRPWHRVAEPVIIIAIYVTLSAFLPLFFPCTRTQCFVPEGQTTLVCPEVRWLTAAVGYCQRVDRSPFR